MNSTLVFITIIIVLWGIWGFFSKIAAERLGGQLVFWESIVIVSVTMLYLFLTNQLYPVKNDSMGILFGVGAGLATAVASILFYLLLQKQPAGYLLAVTALYPVVTIFLSILFLHEGITWHKAIGFIFALIAMYFLNF